MWISRHCLRSWICPGSQADVGLIWKTYPKNSYIQFSGHSQLSHVFNLQLHFCVRLFNQSPNLRPVYYSRQHISNIPVTYKARTGGLAPHSDSNSADGKTSSAERWITGMFTSTEGLVDELVRRLRIRAFGRKPRFFDSKSSFDGMVFYPLVLFFCRCFWPHLNFFKCFFSGVCQNIRIKPHTHTTAVPRNDRPSFEAWTLSGSLMDHWLLPELRCLGSIFNNGSDPHVVSHGIGRVKTTTTTTGWETNEVQPSSPWCFHTCRRVASWKLGTLRILTWRFSQEIVLQRRPDNRCGFFRLGSGQLSWDGDWIPWRNWWDCCIFT